MPTRPKVLLAFGICAFVLLATGCTKSPEAGPPTASIAGQNEVDSGAAAEAKRLANQYPTVVLVTSLGEITVELNRVQAQITVNNFLSYVAGHRFDQTIFHQVEPGFMALAGGFSSDLKPIPAEVPIRNEAHNGLKNLRGTIAMARDFNAVDSATSQFFFNLADNPTLDHQPGSLESYGYCVFGKVTAGMDVLDRIGAVEVQETERFPKLPRQPVVIETVRVR